MLMLPDFGEKGSVTNATSMRVRLMRQVLEIISPSVTRMITAQAIAIKDATRKRGII